MTFEGFFSTGLLNPIFNYRDFYWFETGRTPTHTNILNFSSWCIKNPNHKFNCFLSLWYRHPTELELHSHVVLGPQSFRHLLHPGRTWTLLHRCVHCLLHHYQALPVLPHSSQHPGLPAEPTGSHLVPHVLLLRVQCQRTRPQRVLLALLQTCCDKEDDRIEEEKTRETAVQSETT